MDDLATRDRAAATDLVPQKRNGRTRRLFIVDAALFAVLVLVINVPLTGLTVHEWLGIVIGIGFIVHLVQHADWIAATGQRIFSKTSFQNRLKYLLMVGLFAGFASIIVSGLLVSESALPLIGITPRGGSFWLWLHLASVGWVLWLTAIHVALGWRWIVSTTDRLVLRRLEGGSR
jgi:hypothetical protein